MRTHEFRAPVVPALLTLAVALGCTGDDAADARDEPLSREEADAELGDALEEVEEAHRRAPFAIPTAADAEESAEVLRVLRERVVLPGAATRGPGARTTGLTLYEVVDREAQDEIVRVLGEARDARGWKPIRLVFKRAEVTTTRDVEGGGTLTRRGDEEVLREVTIE